MIYYSIFNKLVGGNATILTVRSLHGLAHEGKRMTKFFSLLVTFLITAPLGTLALAYDIRSVKPEVYHAPQSKSLDASPLKLKANSAAAITRISLEPVQQREIEQLKNNNARLGKKRLQIGFSRKLSILQRDQIAPQTLQWMPVDSGGLGARVSVTSPQASALRLGLVIRRMDPGVELRFYGSGQPSMILGPVTAAEVSSQQGTFWAPVTSGETAYMEIFIPSYLTTESFVFELPEVSHLVAGPQRNFKSISDIGNSDYCERDLVCVNPTTALKNASSAVAKMVYTEGGFTYLCTGTLLNDAVPTTFEPYFYTAHHCLATQSVANSLNTYFFFEAATCGAYSAPNYKQVTGGAALLHTSQELDSTLLRLNRAPPSGVVFAGWDANPVNAGQQATALHHPWGDLKKISTGYVSGYGAYEGRGSFIHATWTQGSTEGGSSGSGLFTFDGTNYVLRGGLLGGTHSCSFPTGTDSYSRLDYVLPFIKQYIATAPVAQAGNSLEFFNTTLNHYFMTADTAEATGIDNGAAGPGWIRTGQNFKIWPTLAEAASGALAVCRFYTRGANSHFYTLDPAECQGLKDLEVSQRRDAEAQGRTFTGWQFEGIAYYAAPPVNGACAGGTQPIYRAYNNRAAFNDSNHRFMPNVALYQQMTGSGWIGEGVAMCAPN